MRDSYSSLLPQPERNIIHWKSGLIQLMHDSEELLESAHQRILESFIGLNGHTSDWAFVTDKIRHTLSEYLSEKTHRRPWFCRW